MQFGPGERTVAHVLARRAAETPHLTWLRWRDERLSYERAQQRSNRLAQGLIELGVGADATVLVLLPNSVEFVIIWCALAQARTIMVPLNTALRGTPLVHQVNDSEADWIIVECGLLDCLEHQADRIPGLRNCIVLGCQSLDEVYARHPRFTVGRKFHRYEDCQSAGTSSPSILPAYNDIAAVMYTSGTTGSAKGVMVYHAHAFTYAFHNGNSVDLAPGDTVYLPLPLFHVAGLWAGVFACAIHGATAAIADVFSLSKFWSEVDFHRANVCYLLGVMGRLLAQYQTEPKHSTLERMLIVPLPPDIAAFAQRLGVKMSTAYASTEVGGCVVFHRLQLPNASSCGRVDPSRMSLRIVDENDEPVESGKVGEIAIRPNEPWIVMAGYWKQPEATVKVWRNLWLHTGDLGYLDEDGNLTFVDRLKDAIRRRGENISSVEVENEIAAQPDVLECAVFPVESPDTEQEVMASVVLKSGHHLEPRDLIAFLEARLPYFMIPRYIDFIGQLPKTETGKVKKSDLRSAGVTSGTWDREASGMKLKRR